MSNKLAEGRARASASEVLRALSISDPESLDVGAIAYMRNILVDEAPLDNCDGRLVIRNAVGKATVNSAIPEAGKRRFVAAHELGHFEMHREKTTIFNCTEEYFDLWRKQNLVHEREANVFASELLMPRDMFDKAAKGAEPNFEAIKHLGGYLAQP
jgi:Zn-dependent peptidase ImmA (M78 family)